MGRERKGTKETRGACTSAEAAGVFVHSLLPNLMSKPPSTCRWVPQSSLARPSAWNHERARSPAPAWAKRADIFASADETEKRECAERIFWEIREPRRTRRNYDGVFAQDYPLLHPARQGRTKGHSTVWQDGFSIANVSINNVQLDASVLNYCHVATTVTAQLLWNANINARIEDLKFKISSLNKNKERRFYI